MPAPKTTWPHPADLLNFFSSESFDVGSLSALDLESTLESAVSHWETDTLYTPFLAASDAVATTQRFDPPGGRILSLRGGLISLVSLVVRASKDDPGEELELDEDFWLSPDGASGQDKPYRDVEFACEPGGRPKSIRITGVWGYAASLPENVWRAVLCRAACELVPRLSLGISGGLVSQKVQDGEEVYSSGGKTPLTLAAEVWKEQYCATARKYRRK